MEKDDIFLFLALDFFYLIMQIVIIFFEYFDITIQSKSNKTLVATLILPVSDENQIQEIIASKYMKPEKNGGISLNF